VDDVKHAVLFDLGGTLAHYFEGSEFPGVLGQAITEVREALRRRGLLHVSSEVMWRRVQDEDREAPAHCARPLEGRLSYIFELGEADWPSPLMMTLRRCFMKPIFARGRRYPEAIPVLQKLKSVGLKTAIISNAPWGSPSALWREEVRRLGLEEWMDLVAFHGDVGWRKPARRIFEFALERLRVELCECIFVEDDPRWDLAGPRAVGMEAVLIDRWGGARGSGMRLIESLYELVSEPGLVFGA